MWSVSHNGRQSPFTARHRVLFPVLDSSENTKKCLLRALEHRHCTGVVVLEPGNRRILTLISQTLQTLRTKSAVELNPLIVCMTDITWTRNILQDCVRDTITHLRVDKLDVLLLSRPPTLTVSGRSVSVKPSVLELWDAMRVIKRRELAHAIGLSDFTIQEMELIFNTPGDNHPTVLSTEVGISPTGQSAITTATAFRTMLSFVHGHEMDLIVRLAYDGLTDNLSKVGNWRHCVDEISTRHRNEAFDVAVVHEADREKYRMEKRSRSQTSTLQSSTELLVRYLIQVGVIVVPFRHSEDNDNYEDESYKIFNVLTHPFSDLPPHHSPQTQYSRILSKEDLQLIEHTVSFQVMVPRL